MREAEGSLEAGRTTLVESIACGRETRRGEFRGQFYCFPPGWGVSL